jgi:1-acyl-sn-glycerol-3-phosphate acyltransferase
MGQDHSVIIFPEGGRFSGPEPMPFKGGLFHLAQKRPDVELIPVLMDNLNRILPKGEVLPVPVLGNVTFGAPVKVLPEETKPAFLERARAEVMRLRNL